MRITGDTHSEKIVVLGSMTKMPVAGVVWQTMQYVVGFRRLGYDVYYVEAHGRTPSMFSEGEGDNASEKAAGFIDRVMRKFDLGEHWAFHALHADGRVYGMSEAKLAELYRSAALLINLHGGTEPLPEHYATDRLVYLGTDPVQVEIELYHGDERAIDFLEPHCAFFTYGENYGNPDCKLPVSDRFQFRPTRQPVLLDLWRNEADGDAENFTTIGNWRQPWREVAFGGEVYHWSKHLEFMKFVDLPSRTRQPFELALSNIEDEDERMLRGEGWRVRPALEMSLSEDAYRDYILRSRGEFTVAKDQNVRLRSGWFSDRSASYLAAGRPVITQETGFTNIFPSGRGLFGFSTMDEILCAVEAINADYVGQSRAAWDIAREFFSYDRVLTRLLDDIGMERQSRKLESKTRPLPRPACRAYLDASLPAELAPQSVVHVQCVVENQGYRPFTSAPPYPVHISYQWIDALTGQWIGEEGRRTPFSDPLGPGQRRRYGVQVMAPRRPGDFILRLTLVQEQVAWFSDLAESNACSARVHVGEGERENSREGVIEAR